MKIFSASRQIFLIWGWLLLAPICSAKVGTEGVKNAPRSKLSGATKPTESPELRQLQIWNLALKKSHEIFREVWAHLWEDRNQNPMSVFLDLQKLIQAHKSNETGLFIPRLADCRARVSEIEMQMNSGKVVTGAVFYVSKCDRLGRIEKGRDEVARVQKTTTGWAWTFYDEFLPRSAGQSLAFLHEKTRCQMELNEKDRLQALDCQNLGQNRDAEMHILFSQFRYRKNADPMLLVEGKKFKLLTTAICDSPKFCTQIKVPLNGTIEIYEDITSKQAKEERDRLERQKELAQVAKIAEEENKKRQKELEDKKKKMGLPRVGHQLAPPQAQSQNQLEIQNQDKDLDQAQTQEQEQTQDQVNRLRHYGQESELEREQQNGNQNPNHHEFQPDSKNNVTNSPEGARLTSPVEADNNASSSGSGSGQKMEQAPPAIESRDSQPVIPSKGEPQFER